MDVEGFTSVLLGVSEVCCGRVCVALFVEAGWGLQGLVVAGSADNISLWPVCRTTLNPKRAYGASDRPPRIPRRKRRERSPG